MRKIPFKLVPLLKLATLGLFFLLVTQVVIAQKNRPGMPDSNLSWLDNGTVRIGCDLNFGGAITWFSLSKGENLINNYDAGRQVQMSFYSGPKPFTSKGQTPAKHWAHLGWNPIQAGDDFGDGSKVTFHDNDGKRLRITCKPLQWPLNGIEGDCEFDTEISLHGASAVLKYTLRNQRVDQTQYSARHQELPAVYSNFPYQRVVTATNNKVLEIPRRKDGKWSYWTATEGWAALVDESDWGLGVWSPRQMHFIGGAAGRTAKDSACGYLAPLATEILDYNIEYNYSCDLIIGTIEEIRAHAKRRNGERKAPRWDFSKSRDGWSTLGGPDGGWPIDGGIKLKGRNTLLSPVSFWAAGEAYQVIVEADAVPEGVSLYVKRLGESRFDPQPIAAVSHREGLQFSLVKNPTPGTQLKIVFPTACEIRAIRFEN